MNLSDHIKNEQLAEIKMEWKYLTPSQQITLLIHARILYIKDTLPKTIKHLYYLPLRLLNNLHTYTHPAHWI